MSGLATRCSACGTVFRVVPDQLRVSEGWVRCGRCSQVFNALESLVDLDSGLPRRDFGAGPDGGDDDGGDFTVSRLPALDAPGPAEPPAGLPPAGPAPPARPERGPDGRRDFESTLGPEAAEPAGAAMPAMASITAITAHGAAGPAPGAASPAAAPWPPAASAPAPLAQAQTPSFVRRAEQAERWRRPGVRAALATGVLLAAATLAAQAAHTWRDRLAARVPAAAPALEAACRAVGCRVDAPRVLDALTVESSGLVRIERSNLYRLQVVLKNRAPHAVAAPAVDLVLTDLRGAVVTRRVLPLAELGGDAEPLPGGAERALGATLEAIAPAGEAAPLIAGYTVELFYP